MQEFVHNNSAFSLAMVQAVFAQFLSFRSYLHQCKTLYFLVQLRTLDIMAMIVNQHYRSRHSTTDFDFDAF